MRSPAVIFATWWHTTGHPAYDDEAWVSVDAKASIFAEAAAGEWLVAMSHEVSTPLGRLVADGDRFRFIAE